MITVVCPETEKLTAIIATTKADELSSEKHKSNWLESWTIDGLRQWQDEDSAIKTVKTGERKVQLAQNRQRLHMKMEK